MGPLTVVMQGGLGNQLFQYFAGAQIAKSDNRRLILDISLLQRAQMPRTFELENFSLPYDFEITSRPHSNISIFVDRLSKKIGFNLKPRNFVSTVVGYDPKLAASHSFTSIKGYFQSWRYVQPFRHQLNLNLHTEWTEAMREKALGSNPIVMHIRRGDYLHPDEKIGALSLDYFKKAMSILSVRGIEGKVWVFSDSPEIIDPQFLNEIDAELIMTPSNLMPAEIMSVMSLGRAIVISNSTFSWWAAYAKSNSIVIAPDQWFRSQENPVDLYPESWIVCRSEWQ